MDNIINGEVALASIFSKCNKVLDVITRMKCYVVVSVDSSVEGNR